jgi:hypothetical protein
MTEGEPHIVNAIQELKTFLGNAFTQQTKAITEGSDKTTAPVPPSLDKVKVDDQGPDVGNSKVLSRLTKVFRNVFMPEFLKATARDPSKNSGEARKSQRNEENQLGVLRDTANVSAKSSDMLKTLVDTEKESFDQRTDSEKRLKAEKTVVKSADKMILSDIEPKATKKFGGLFDSITGLFSKKKTTNPQGDIEEESSGWLSTILSTIPYLALTAGSAIFGGIMSGVKLITGGISAGIGLVGDLVTNSFNWFKEGGISRNFNRLRTGVGDFFGSIGKNLTKAKEYIGKTKIGKLVTGLGTEVSKLITSAKTGVSTMFTNMGTRLSETWTSITNVFRKTPPVPPGVNKSMAKLGATVGGTVAATTTATTATASKGLLKGAAKGALRLAGPIAAAGFALYGGATAAWDEYEKSGSIMAAAKEGIAGAASSLTFGLVSQETFSGIMTSVGDGIGATADYIGNLFSTGLGGLADIASGNIAKGLGGVGEYLTAGLVDAESITGFVDGVGDTFSAAGSYLSEGASSVLDSISGFFTNSPEVWDVFDESGKKLSSGAIRTQAATAGVLQSSEEQVLALNKSATTSDAATKKIIASQAKSADIALKTASTAEAGSKSWLDSTRSATAGVLQSSDSQTRALNNAAIVSDTASRKIIASQSRSTDMALKTVSTTEAGTKSWFDHAKTMFSYSPLGAVASVIGRGASFLADKAKSMFSGTESTLDKTGDLLGSSITELIGTIKSWIDGSAAGIPDPNSPKLSSDLTKVQQMQTSTTEHQSTLRSPARLVEESHRDLSSTVKLLDRNVNQLSPKQPDNKELVVKLTEIVNVQQQQLVELRANNKLTGELPNHLAVKPTTNNAVVQNSSNTIVHAGDGGSDLSMFRARVGAIA